MTHALQHGASSSSGSGAEPSSAPALSLRSGVSPAAWVNLSDLLTAFDAPNSGAQHDKARRWWSELPAAQRRKLGGRLQVLADNATRLPNGLSPLAVAKGCGPGLAPSSTLAGLRLPPGHEQWSTKDRQRFLDTHALLRAWDEHRESNPATIEAALIGTFRAPPLATPLKVSLRRLNDYRRRLPINGNIDKRGRCAAAPSIANETLTPGGELIDAAWDRFKELFLAPQRRSVSLCYAIVAAEAERTDWSWPALRTVQQRVKQELPAAIADYWRLGAKRWERSHAPRIERDYSVYRPNQCWVGDNHHFDVVVLHRGEPVRPWLSAWLDMRSRVLAGWIVGASANSDTILAAFARGAQQYGVPTEVVVDNGRDFCAKAFVGRAADPAVRRKSGFTPLDTERVQSVFGRLHVEVTFCKPFEPQSKPIESFFKTVCAEFSKLWESYCGGKPDDRPEELYADLRKQRIVPPSLDEFEARFSEWVRTVYHLRAHSGDGMDGRTPAEVFAIDPIARATAPQSYLDLLLRKTVPATVTKRGVRYNKTQYGQANLDLQRLHGRKVLLGINPADASVVNVFDFATGEHLTDARQQRLAGITTEEVREGAKRQARAKRIAQKAGPALRDRHKSVVEHALEVQAEQLAADGVQPLAATGTDAADRSVRLLQPTLQPARSAPRFEATLPPASAIHRPTFADEGAEAAPRVAARPLFSAGDDDLHVYAPASRPQFTDDDDAPQADTPADRLARLFRGAAPEVDGVA